MCCYKVKGLENMQNTHFQKSVSSNLPPPRPSVYLLYVIARLTSMNNWIKSLFMSWTLETESHRDNTLTVQVFNQKRHG